MRYMYKIFFETDAKKFDDIYRARISYDSTVLLGLNIKPMNQPNIYELYYVPTNQMLQKINTIHIISREFNKIFNELPKVAQNQFINECLVEELYSTNELEGIRSTREEIARSAKSIRLNKHIKTRFGSMIKSYLRLLSGDIVLPKLPQDIRNIYDDITDGEIDKEELPDGEIFRKEITYILKKSGTGKVIHKGITPENRIIEGMKQLLDFMNNRDEIPLPIRIAVGHYYFGYIHPFYDGNGRTSRFISSMYLAEVLGNISTLSISRGCNKFRNKYLESFEITNSIRNRGEMNCFIETFLDIIINALIEMNTELKEKHELLKLASAKIENDPVLNGKDEIYKEIMFVLAQNHFFDISKGLTIKELGDIFNKSEATIRKAIKDMLELELVEKQGERPAFYGIKKHYFDN